MKYKPAKNNVIDAMLENTKIVKKNSNKKIILCFSIWYILITIVIMIYMILYKGFLHFLLVSIKYFTNWGYITTFIFSILRCLRIFKFRIKKNFWNTFFNFVIVNNIFISIFFWTILFRLIEDKNDIYKIIISYIYSHTCPCLYTLILFFLEKKKFKYRNFWYNWIGFSLYGFVNIFFHFNGVTVYPVLNYKNFISLVFIVSGYLFVTIIHFTLVFIKKLLKKNIKDK